MYPYTLPSFLVLNQYIHCMYSLSIIHLDTCTEKILMARAHPFTLYQTEAILMTLHK